MKVGELKSILNRDDRHDDRDVKVVLDIPSLGGRAYSVVENAAFGFDWERGLMIVTKEPLTIKESNQEIYEQASDLLMMLATEFYVVKKPKYENRISRRILLRNGYTEKDLIKYVKLFHRDKEIIITEGCQI